MDFSKRKVQLELLNALIFGITIVGANLIGFFDVKPPIYIQIVSSVLLAAVYFIIAQSRLSEGTRSFTESSPKFYEFFKKWYSLPGTLTIYCSDLEWLDNELGSQVVYALERKKDQLYIYLRRPHGNVIRKLLSCGANVYQIKEEIITDHRFSMIENDGLKRIIVRNKRTEIDSDVIEFKETNNNEDPYIISLAEDLIDDCWESGISL